MVAGIGCSGRISAYLDYSTVHTAHGRALAVATGVKAADPSLHVIVAMGDGDSSAIGGNHFIHAARRNIDLTALVFNNSIYGMTGGQMSPTTHLGDKSTTSVYGNVEPAFDLCELAHAAGATYVARGTSWAYQQLTNVIAGGHLPQGLRDGRGDGRSARSTTGASTSRPTRRSSSCRRRSTPSRPTSSTRARRAATTSTRSGCCTTPSARSSSPRWGTVNERAREAGNG